MSWKFVFLIILLILLFLIDVRAALIVAGLILVLKPEITTS